MIKRYKVEVIATKCHRNRGRISLFSKEKENYDSDTIDNMDSD